MQMQYNSTKGIRYNNELSYKDLHHNNIAGAKLVLMSSFASVQFLFLAILSQVTSSQKYCEMIFLFDNSALCFFSQELRIINPRYKKNRRFLKVFSRILQLFEDTSRIRWEDFELGLSSQQSQWRWPEPHLIISHASKSVCHA